MLSEEEITFMVLKYGSLTAAARRALHTDNIKNSEFSENEINFLRENVKWVDALFIMKDKYYK